MSGSVVINPPPENVGGIHIGDTDSRGFDYSVDLKQPNVPVNDPIPDASHVTVAISRVDGNSTGGNDLQVSGSPVLQDATPGYVPVIGLHSPSTGLPNVPYYVSFTATTTSGRVVVRDIVVLVMPRRG